MALACDTFGGDSWEDKPELRAALNALVADAELYRWLRFNVAGVVPMARVQIMRRGQYVLIKGQLDDTIRAAMGGH